MAITLNIYVMNIPILFTKPVFHDPGDFFTLQKQGMLVFKLTLDEDKFLLLIEYFNPSPAEFLK